MKSIDRLLKEAKRIVNVEPVEKYGMHIIENGHCYSCKGACKHIGDDNCEVLVDDIMAVEVMYEVDSFKGVPKETLIKIAKLSEEEDTWRINGYDSNMIHPPT